MRALASVPDTLRSSGSHAPSYVRVTAERLRPTGVVFVHHAHSSTVRLRVFARDLVERIDLVDLLDALPPQTAAQPRRFAFEKVVGFVDAFRDQARDLDRHG